ncbi:hypothetical protein GQ53DRAFT_763871 [Thozetella sp. PMI_491]|nr:hypothetical protein GQ53DRAFT_763871 [Thozetella sp. PMI_491]
MDKLRDARESTARFLRSSRFNPRHKTKVHILQICLVIAVFIFTGARIATKPSGMPVTRSDTLGIVMGVKTIVVLLYQILTSKVERFQRWKSLKANTILNSMEIVFWFVVVIITLMGISRFCQGAFCALSWIQVLVAIMLMFVQFHLAMYPIRN